MQLTMKETRQIVSALETAFNGLAPYAFTEEVEDGPNNRAIQEIRQALDMPVIREVRIAMASERVKKVRKK